MAADWRAYRRPTDYQEVFEYTEDLAPGWSHDHAEKAGKPRDFVVAVYEDTPTDIRADVWLSLNICSCSWTSSIESRASRCAAFDR
jgi:hypothetical protein